MKCVYEKITPENYKNVSEGSCIKYSCSGDGELAEGIVCSHQYGPKSEIQLRIQEADSGATKIIGGKVIWVQKKKKKIGGGDFTVDDIKMSAIREELNNQKKEIEKLKRIVNDLTAAIKLLRFK